MCFILSNFWGHREFCESEDRQYNHGRIIHYGPREVGESGDLYGPGYIYTGHAPGDKRDNDSAALFDDPRQIFCRKFLPLVNGSKKFSWNDHREIAAASDQGRDNGRNDRGDDDAPDFVGKLHDSV